MGYHQKNYEAMSVLYRERGAMFGYRSVEAIALPTKPTFERLLMTIGRERARNSRKVPAIVVWWTCRTRTGRVSTDLENDPLAYTAAGGIGAAIDQRRDAPLPQDS
jgi:hypothetical protein